jgi:hypothetical protein
MTTNPTAVVKPPLKLPSAALARLQPMRTSDPELRDATAASEQTNCKPSH